MSVELEAVKEETKRSIGRVREELKRLEGVLRLEQEELLALETMHDWCPTKSSVDSQ